MSPRQSRRHTPPLSLIRLEDRTLPASMITVAPGANGSGSLDSFLFDASPGAIATTDGGGNPGTLSTGALTAVNSATNISVSALNGINFADLGGTVTLQTGTGNRVVFDAGSGAISAANKANTLGTNGASVAFLAGTSLGAFNLNTAGGDVTLVGGVTQAAVVAPSDILAGGGDILVRSTNAGGGSISHVGNAVGQSITFAARGDVFVGGLQGASVSLTSNTGSVKTFLASPVQTTGQLTITAATGIDVQTLAASLQARNTTAGNVSIQQMPTLARPLTVVGLGVRNEAPFGSVSIVNLGDSVTVSAGSVAFSGPGGPIGLSGQDVNILGLVNSNTAGTTISSTMHGMPIDLGSNTSGKIGLTLGDLNNVTAAYVRVGSDTAGPITVSASITAPTGWRTLTLLTGSNIAETAGGSLTVPNLRISVAGPVSLSSPNKVSSLAAETAGVFSFNNGGNGLVIGAVDGANGVNSSGYDVAITTGGLDVQQPVNAGGGGVTFRTFDPTTRFELGGAGMGGALGLSDVELGRVTAGVLEIAAVGPIAVTSPITRHAGYNTLKFTTALAVSQSAPLSVSRLALALPGGTVVLTDAGNDIDTLAAQASGSPYIYYRDANSIAIGTVPGFSGIVDNGAVVMLTASSITDGNGPGVNVVADLLIVTATAGIDIDTQVNSISATSTGNGPIILTQSGPTAARIDALNAGSGTVTLDGGTFTLGGDNVITSGLLNVTGATLGGTGTIATPVTVNSGTISPGPGPGTIGTGNLQFAPGAVFAVDVNSPYAQAGTDYDRLNVTGTVALNSATLSLVGGTVAAPVGTVLTIIANDGTDPVLGTFGGLPAGSIVVAGAFQATISYTGGDGNDVTLTAVSPTPVLRTVTVDDGTAQRSMVRSLTVTFVRPVSFAGSPAAAFRLTRTGPGATGDVLLSVDLSGSTLAQTVARLTFSGSLTQGPRSLIDGNYTLTVLSGQIRNGLQGVDSVTSLHRLFGDVNGDKTVNGLDMTAFRTAFGTGSADAGYSSFLDFNGDGAINGTDLAQFRNRFGVILP